MCADVSKPFFLDGVSAIFDKENLEILLFINEVRGDEALNILRTLNESGEPLTFKEMLERCPEMNEFNASIRLSLLERGKYVDKHGKLETGITYTVSDKTYKMVDKILSIMEGLEKKRRMWFRSSSRREGDWFYSWDVQHPKSYVYERTDEIKRFKERIRKLEEEAE